VAIPLSVGEEKEKGLIGFLLGFLCRKREREENKERK
jgi:hypothetical protein